MMLKVRSEKSFIHANNIMLLIDYLQEKEFFIDP